MSTNQKKMSNGLMQCNVIVAAFSQSSYPIQVVSTNLIITCSCIKGEVLLRVSRAYSICFLRKHCINIGNHNKKVPPFVYRITLFHVSISAPVFNYRGQLQCDLMSITFSVSLPYLCNKPKKIVIFNPNKHQFIQFIRQSCCGHIISKLTE